MTVGRSCEERSDEAIEESRWLSFLAVSHPSEKVAEDGNRWYVARRCICAKYDDVAARG